MANIHEAANAFLELAKAHSGKTLTSDAEIAEFWSELMRRTGGLVIVDFLDNTNWDYITAARFDAPSRVLQLTWRDYGGRDKSDISAMMFPATTYGLVMKVQDVAAFASCVFIRGYVVKQKELQSLLQPLGTDEFHLDKENLFRRTVYARTGEHWHLWHAHVAAVYSVALLPKGVGASSWRANVLLFMYNLEVADREIGENSLPFRRDQPADKKSMQSSANNVRTLMESALKVECIYRKVKLPSEYPDLKLGALVAGLKDGWSLGEREAMNRAIRVLNEYSHDTGLPMKQRELEDVIEFCRTYVNQLRADVASKLQ